MRTSLLVIRLTTLLAVFAVSHGRSVQSSPSDKVKVEFFVMSKCPDAAYCEATFAPALYQLSPILDLSFDYIAQRDTAVTLANITCPHGEGECEGNRQQLCAQLLSSPHPLTLQYLNFTTCQAASYRTVPTNAIECAQQAGFDADKLQSCVSSVGQQLLLDSVNYSRARNQSVSCSVLVDNNMWCQRDSTWKQCNEGTTGDSLITAVCKRYRGSDTPAICQQALGRRGLLNRLKW